MRRLFLPIFTVAIAAALPALADVPPGPEGEAQQLPQLTDRQRKSIRTFVFTEEFVALYALTSKKLQPADREHYEQAAAALDQIMLGTVGSPPRAEVERLMLETARTQHLPDMATLPADEWEKTIGGVIAWEAAARKTFSGWALERAVFAANEMRLALEDVKPEGAKDPRNDAPVPQEAP